MAATNLNMASFYEAGSYVQGLRPNVMPHCVRRWGGVVSATSDCVLESGMRLSGLPHVPIHVFLLMLVVCVGFGFRVMIQDLGFQVCVLGRGIQRFAFGGDG